MKALSMWCLHTADAQKLGNDREEAEEEKEGRKGSRGRRRAQRLRDQEASTGKQVGIPLPQSVSAASGSFPLSAFQEKP